MAYSHLLVYIYFVFLSIISNFVRLFSPFNTSENDDIIPDDQIMANAIEKKTKRETIPRLVKLGLTPEQIAEALDLLVPEVKKIIASQSE